MEPLGIRAYQLILRMADRTLERNIAAYRQKIAATTEFELIMMNREQRDGNKIAANRHMIRAEIYKSILDKI